MVTKDIQITRQSSLKSAVHFHADNGYPSGVETIQQKLEQVVKTAEYFTKYVTEVEFGVPLMTKEVQVAEAASDKKMTRALPPIGNLFHHVKSFIGSKEYNRVMHAMDTYFFSEEQMAELAALPNWAAYQKHASKIGQNEQ